MKYKYKNIIIAVIVILIISLLSWFILLRPKIGSDDRSKTIELTNDKKIDLLNQTSQIPPKIISDTEKQKIIKNVGNINVPIPSDEEKLKILNQTN